MRAAVHALRQCAAEAPAHIRQVFWCCSTGSSKKYKSISFFYKHCFATSLYFWFCVSAKSCQNLRLKNWISKNNFKLLWTGEAFFSPTSRSILLFITNVWIVLRLNFAGCWHLSSDSSGSSRSAFSWLNNFQRSPVRFQPSTMELEEVISYKNVKFYKMTVLWEMTLLFQELIKLRQVTKITTWKSMKPVVSVLDAIFRGFRFVGVTEVQVPFIW